jgi:hypothetical protein
MGRSGRGARIPPASWALARTRTRTHRNGLAARRTGRRLRRLTTPQRCAQMGRSGCGDATRRALRGRTRRNGLGRYELPSHRAGSYAHAGVGQRREALDLGKKRLRPVGHWHGPRENERPAAGWDQYEFGAAAVSSNVASARSFFQNPVAADVSCFNPQEVRADSRLLPRSWKRRKTDLKTLSVAPLEFCSAATRRRLFRLADLSARQRPPTAAR